MKRRAVFASDFHLSGRNPSGVDTFCRFVGERVRAAADLYLLGDLFDLWIGPTQLEEAGLVPAFDALRRAARGGTKIHLFHGNRDFLLGEREAKSLQAALAGESLQVTIHGERAFLTHGDIFCTRDRAYQRMKKILRNPVFRGAAGFLPGRLIRRLAGGLRTHSTKVVSVKPKEVTAIQIPEVERILGARGACTAVCGHVHNSFERDLPGGGRLIVLSEWRDGRGTYAETRDGRIRRVDFPD
jgi:UDP-2,3-diacylglucosamine hydrolase